MGIEISQIFGPLILLLAAYLFSKMFYRTFMIVLSYNGEERRFIVVNGIILMLFCSVTIGAALMGAYKFALGSKYDNPRHRVVK